MTNFSLCESYDVFLDNRFKKYKNIVTFRIQNFLSSPKSAFIET